MGSTIGEMGGDMGHDFEWIGAQPISKVAYRCAYCMNDVAPAFGYAARTYSGVCAYAAICHFCGHITYVKGFGAFQKTFPSPLQGENLDGLKAPETVVTCYSEARASISAGAHTGCIMLCRKILMNMAVELGADTGLSFKRYVDYLVEEGHITKRGKDTAHWIRDQGNDANHEIEIRREDDARRVLQFTALLLRSIYETPDIAPRNRTKPLNE